MRACLKFAVICLPMLALIVPCMGDNGSEAWFFRAWQTEHGLPDNSISGVAQSPDGFLWVATKGGLMRFNGSEFNAMSLRRFPGLPSRAIRAMLLDSRGDIWISMERGPLIRIGVDSVRAYTPQDGLFAQRVTNMTEDADGRVWVGFTGGICRIDGDEVSRFDQKSGIPAYPRLACDSEGRIWLSNRRVLGILDDEGFEQRQEFESADICIAASRTSGIWFTARSELLRTREGSQPETVTSLPDNCVTNVIYEDRDGAVWIGTAAHGLLRFFNGSLSKVPTSHPAIDCLTEDREGNIWAGTAGGGLNLVKPRTAELIRGTNEVPLTSAQSVAIESTGKVWVVSELGTLSSYHDGKWTLESDSEAWLGKLASCVATDSNGRAWVGTRASGLQVYDKGTWNSVKLRPGLHEQVVRSVLASSNGDIWAATDLPFQLHRLRDGKLTSWEVDGPIEYIRAMAEGIDGTIWAASSDGRVLRISGDEPVDEDAIDEPLPLSVRTLHVSSDGSLWIGYAGEGLGHLKNGRYRRITKTDGLYDDFVSQVLDDGLGSLWITSNRGLFQLDLQDLLAVSMGRSTRVRPRVFGRNDGLPSLQPVRNFSPSAARAPDGNLWFSMSRGLLKVQPDKIRENPILPPVVLEKISIDDQPVAIYRSRSLVPEESAGVQSDLGLRELSLVMQPGHDKMEIEFAALSLASPENVHFLYRLKPFDHKWKEPNASRSATYPRLPAGKYNFQVIACNNVGVWNETGAMIDILVRPFFWETWWFKIGGGIGTALAAGGIVFFWARWRHNRQLLRISEKRALEQERSRIARDIHDDLGASLTRITLLSQSTPSSNGPSVESVLDQIHATARHLMRSMEEVVWAVNPEHDTFDALANYLSNYGQGFLGIAGVRCRLEMPMVLPERPLSAQLRHNLFLAFKEALNNAVKYSGASEVRISLKPGEDRFILRVTDNGRGIDPTTPNDPTRSLPGSGLANMQSRMEEIGGTCKLESLKNQGTTIEFEVPFKPNT